MSYYHANVVWQSSDGTWSRGFYTDMGAGGCDCGDETHEWCREFDSSSFQWVSTGHPTEDAAYKAWDGSNPGGCETCAYDPTLPESVRLVAALDDIAARKYEQAQARAEEERSKPRTGYVGAGLYSGRGFISSRSPGYWGYHGPPKTRTLEALQKERNEIHTAWASYRLGGYANVIDEERLKDLNTRISERLKTSSDAEVGAYETRQAAFREAMRERLAAHRERRREDALRNSRYGLGYSARRASDARDRDAREREVEEFIDKMAANAAARAEQRRAAAAPPPPTEKTPTPKKKAPAKKKPAAATARRKTTAKSTAGSFAATVRAEDDNVDLTAASPTQAPGHADDDPWAPL